MAFYRTVALGDTVYFPFAVNSVAGSGTDGASAVASVRQCGTGASVAPVITAAGTNLSHASFPNGAWETGIAVTSGNGFAVGNEYSVFATIAADSQNPTGHIGQFFVDTNDLQDMITRAILSLPAYAPGGASGLATLNNNSRVNADAIAISGDTVAADNLEAAHDGTGYVGGTIKALVNVALVNSNATAASNLQADYDGTGYAGGTVKKQVDVVKVNANSTAAVNLNAMFNGTGYAGGTIPLVVSASANSTNVNVVQVSGNTTAADNMQAMFDGTGYAGGAIELQVDAGGLGTDVNVISIVGSTTAATNLGTVLAVEAGEAGGLPLVDDVLIVDAQVSEIRLVADKLDTMLMATGAVFTYTTSALQNAPSSDLTDDSIALAVEGKLADEFTDLETAIAGLGLGTGGGDTTVTVTVTVASVPIEGIMVTVRDQAETGAEIGPVETDASGEAVFYLTDAADYRAIAPTSTAYSGGATNFTVAGATAVSVTMTALTIPAVGTADTWVLYNYERKLEGNAAWGLSTITIAVSEVDPDAQVDSVDNLMNVVYGTTYTTDANGLWTLTIPQILDDHWLTVEKSWTNAAGKVKTEKWRATIDGSLANGNGQIAWADLAPKRC